MTNLHACGRGLATLCLILCWAVATPLAQSSGGEQKAQAEVGSATPAGFRLSAGDGIELKFFYNPELNDSMVIRPDGCVSLPLVGDVTLQGKTIAEAAKDLEGLYREFLIVPSISIQVRSYGSQKVYVGGEVSRPGVVPLSSRLTVLEAIMEVGGIKHTGNTSKVILIRKNGEGLPERREIVLRGKKNEAVPDAALALMPFDIILVPETKVARLDRWIDQHIRQMIPLTLSAGFSYLGNAGGVVR
jgi:polysaccharide export outer membrane protein